MIFKFKEISCTYAVLKMLSKEKSKYSKMFKETKVSHTTLQRSLKELINKEFIVKRDIGHQNVDYEITEKGKKLLINLNNLYNLTI